MSDKPRDIDDDDEPIDDYDNPEWTEEDFANAVRFDGVSLFEAAAVMRRLRGPQKTPTKQQVTLRLDRDLVERFRAGGPGWQTRINETLRKAVG